MTLFPLRPTHREARPEVWLPGACSDAKEIFAAARQALAHLLGDRPFALYRRVDGLYLPEGRGLDQAPAFAASSSLVAALRRSQRPVMATGSCCALALRARLQPRDVEILDRLSAVALLPMVADGALLGFLCLARDGRPALGSVASAVTMLLAAAETRLCEKPAARLPATHRGGELAVRAVAAAS